LAGAAPFRSLKSQLWLPRTGADRFPSNVARNEDLPEDKRIVFRIGELDASFCGSVIVERVPLQPSQELKTFFRKAGLPE
jgi:hypothetical protein